MTVAMHRVVGVLEWPTDSDTAADVLAQAYQHQTADFEPSTRILSLRLPIPEATSSTIVSADVARLRRDLQRLFAAVSTCNALRIES